MNINIPGYNSKNILLYLFYSLLIILMQSGVAIAEYTTNERYIPDLDTQQGFISEALEHAKQGINAVNGSDMAAAEDHARAAYKSAKRVSSQGQAKLMNEASGHIRKSIKAAKDQESDKYLTHAKAAIDAWSAVDLKAN